MLSQVFLFMGIILLVEIAVTGRRTLPVAQGNGKNRSPIIKAITNIAGLDAVFRLIQFFLIFIAGVMVNNSRFIMDHSRLIIVGRAHKLDKLSNFFGRARKICRLSRTKGITEDLIGQTKTLSSFDDKLKFLENLFGYLGDFFNVVFFFGDHYTSLFLIGLLVNVQHEVMADYIFNIIWTLSNVFYVFKDVVTVVRLQSMKKLTNKQKQYIFVDVLRNILDIIINISFIVEGCLTKKVVGLLGVGASALWLTDFWRT